MHYFLYRPELSGQKFTVMQLMLFVIIMPDISQLREMYIEAPLNTGEELMFVGISP